MTRNIHRPPPVFESPEKKKVFSKPLEPEIGLTLWHLADILSDICLSQGVLGVSNDLCPDFSDLGVEDQKRHVTEAITKISDAAERLAKRLRSNDLVQGGQLERVPDLGERRALRRVTDELYDLLINWDEAEDGDIQERDARGDVRGSGMDRAAEPAALREHDKLQRRNHAVVDDLKCADNFDCPWASCQQAAASASPVDMTTRQYRRIALPNTRVLTEAHSPPPPSMNKSRDQTYREAPDNYSDAGGDSDYESDFEHYLRGQRVPRVPRCSGTGRKKHEGRLSEKFE